MPLSTLVWACETREAHNGERVGLRIREARNGCGCGSWQQHFIGQHDGVTWKGVVVPIRLLLVQNTDLVCHHVPQVLHKRWRSAAVAATRLSCVALTLQCPMIDSNTSHRNVMEDIFANGPLTGYPKHRTGGAPGTPWMFGNNNANIKALPAMFP